MKVRLAGLIKFQYFVGQDRYGLPCTNEPALGSIPTSQLLTTVRVIDINLHFLISYIEILNNFPLLVPMKINEFKFCVRALNIDKIMSCWYSVL